MCAGSHWWACWRRTSGTCCVSSSATTSTPAPLRSNVPPHTPHTRTHHPPLDNGVVFGECAVYVHAGGEYVLGGHPTKCTSFKKLRNCAATLSSRKSGHSCWGVHCILVCAAKCAPNRGMLPPPHSQRLKPMHPGVGKHTRHAIQLLSVRALEGVEGVLGPSRRSTSLRKGLFQVGNSQLSLSQLQPVNELIQQIACHHAVYTEPGDPTGTHKQHTHNTHRTRGRLEETQHRRADMLSAHKGNGASCRVRCQHHPGAVKKLTTSYLDMPIRWSVMRFWGKLYVRMRSLRSADPTCCRRRADRSSTAACRRCSNTRDRSTCGGIG